MTQQVRGAIPVTINGQTYDLKPSFKAIDMIEAATGLGLPEMLRAAITLHVGTVARVLFHALHANDHKKLTYDQVGEAVTEDAATEGQPLISATITFLNAYFPKGQAEEKKPEADETEVTG